MTVHFVQDTQGVQCQERMSTLIHLRTVDLKQNLKHVVVSEFAFWYCFKSKAASQHMEHVRPLQVKKI